MPEILASKAYKNGGLLVITVDEAPSSGAFADSSSCCGQPQFPNLPAPAGEPIAGLPSKGGGEVGALLLSPYVKAGTTNQEQYNHFSLLRTIEDLYGLKHLGYAGPSGVSSFDAVGVLGLQRLSQALRADELVVGDRLASLPGAVKDPLERHHVPRVAQVGGMQVKRASCRRRRGFRRGSARARGRVAAGWPLPFPRRARADGVDRRSAGLTVR